MPAVTIRLRWPDGQESNTYSPSTRIYEYFDAGKSYPLSEFLQRAENGFNAASERVKQIKGFYCSSAMDSLESLRLRAAAFTDGDPVVDVLSIKHQTAGHVSYAAFGDL